MRLTSLSTLALLLTASIASADPSAQVADLLARADYERAHEVAEDWQDREPDSAAAAYWYGASAGQLAMRSGMFKAMGLAGDVKEAFEKAVELDPGNVKAQFALMQFHLSAPGMMGGDKDEARAIAGRIGALSPAAGHRAQAVLKAMDKDSEGYLAEMRKALALEPASPEVVGVIAGHHMSQKEYAEARAIIDAALAIDPAHPLLRYQLGKWSAVSGEELEQGLAIFDELLAMPVYPADFSLSGAHYRRAQVLRALGRRDDAIAAYQSALAVEKRFKAAEDELAALRKSA
jgi:tetratricopeptide (TPR) repeat protein